MAARSTALASDLVPDDPLDQDADYEFGAVDRQYIDTQILAAQLHLSRLINGTYQTWYRVSSGSATLTAGDVVCLASDGTSEAKVTLATPAALAVARVAIGVVLAAASPGARARVAAFGVVHPDTTGLATGAAGFVRVSSAGRAEKVASFSSGDYPLGTVDNAGFLAVVTAPAIGTAGVASVSVLPPILDTGTPAVPIIGLDYTLAATANKVPIRGASGESSFTRVYTAGTVHPSAVLSVARNTTILGGKTSGGDDHDFLTEDGGDGLIYGTRTRSALHAFRCKTGGYLTVGVDAVEVFRASATGINIPTSLTYAVNGVGHATAATASSLAFRGASGELSVGYLYSAGSVAGVGFIRLARNFTAIACKTSGGTDHPILVEDNADGFVQGSDTLTAGWTTHVKTGGSWVLKVNNATKTTLDATGINIATGLLYQVNGVTVASAPSGIPTLGNTSTANTYINVASGGTISLQVNSAERAAVNNDGILLPTDKAVTIGSDVVISAPSNVPTVGSNAAGAVDIRGGNSATIRILINNVTTFAVDSTGVGFFGADPVGAQTVSGAKGGNAALASLLTALVNLGLITDSTSA